MDRVAQVAIEALALIDRQWPADDEAHRGVKEAIASVTAHLNAFVAHCADVEHDTVARWYKQEKITAPCDCAKCDVDTSDRRLFAVREALLDTLAEGEEAEAAAPASVASGVSGAAAEPRPESPVEKFA